MTIDEWLKRVGYNGANNGGIVSIYPEDVSMLRAIAMNNADDKADLCEQAAKLTQARDDMVRGYVGSAISSIAEVYDWLMRRYHAS